MQGVGGDSQFPTTQWTQLEQVARCGREQQQAVIGSLFQRYWRPVYTWLRRQGYPPEVAEEYTQGFFCDIVLERTLLTRADRSKGRFRTFLLTALKGFVSDEYRKDHALKRNPQGGLASLDAAEVVPEGPTAISPDDAFNYMWASNVLDSVIKQLEEEYCRNGREGHWKVFSAKVLRPTLDGMEGPSYEAICQEYGVADVSTAAAMTTTVKRRFRTLLKEVVRPHVEADPDVDDEIGELLEILSRKDARS